MPEGAEVRRWTEELNESLRGRKIKSASVVSGRYMRVDPSVLGLDRLNGAIIERVSCKGKLVVFHLLDENRNSFGALSTLGMAGWWTADRTAYSPDIEKFRRITLELDDGAATFYDPRNFGTFKVVTPHEIKRKLAELGPDVLTAREYWEVMVFPELEARVKRFGKQQTVAEGLLDQRIFAGCGNYIRADAMHRASISPHRPLSKLSMTQLKNLWTCVHEVTKESYQANGEYETKVYGRRESENGNPVESFMDKNGRTVWWVPKEQV